MSAQPDHNVSFPEPYQHDHPPVRNVNRVFEERMTAGQRIADRFATVMGSWPFIIIQSVVLAIWVTLNVVALIAHWDPYPFILLNLMLSFQAAYAAPIIMMSQNRQSEKDRLEAHQDYEVNLKAEEEVRVIMENLEAQNHAIRDLLTRLDSIEARLQRRRRRWAERRGQSPVRSRRYDTLTRRRSTQSGPWGWQFGRAWE